MQYVVEGSVRKVGQRVRITVQLIDAETDHHLWAERYDRDLEDIFAIQDEVTTAIAATLPGRVEAAARDRAARLTTDNMAAYECVLTGKVLHHRSKREDNARALRLLERAIELDPELCPRPRLEGLRARPGLGLQLVREPARHRGADQGGAAKSRSRSTTTTATCTASWRRSTSSRSTTTWRSTTSGGP